MRDAHKIAAAEPWERQQASFDVGRIREDFPILKQRVHDKPLVYLDKCASLSWHTLHAALNGNGAAVSTE